MPARNVDAVDDGVFPAGSGSAMTDPAGAAELRHVALFYRGRDDYLASMAGFVRAALDRREPVLAALPGSGPACCAARWRPMPGGSCSPT